MKSQKKEELKLQVKETILPLICDKIGNYVMAFSDSDIDDAQKHNDAIEFMVKETCKQLKQHYKARLQKQS